MLQFDDVRLPLPDQDQVGVAVDLTLHAGDLVLVQPGDDQHERVLADVACGLVPPERGAVRFLGRPWPELPADQANALRGRIGHLLRRGAWLPYLTLLDNILLPQLHHTRRPYAEIRAEAARLASWFGLPGLPTGRPGDVPPAMLQRAACVRAFLGAPSLIIVESLADDLADGLLAPLINAMRVARDRDAAVLWFCPGCRPLRRPEPAGDQAPAPAGRRARAAGGRRMSDTLPRFRYASRRVGMLVLIAFGIFVIAVLQAGVLRDLFKSTLSLRVILPESGLAGLNEGASVEILGTDAGSVQEIVIDPEQKFHAVVEIEEAMQPFVRRDSKVFIRKQFGIAGAAFLEITRGQGEPLDWDYAVLTAEADQAPTESMGEILEEVRAKVLPIVDDVQRTIGAAGDLIAQLQAPDGQLQMVLGDLGKVTGRLAAGEGTVGRLLADDTLVRELETTLGFGQPAARPARWHHRGLPVDVR